MTDRAPDLRPVPGKAPGSVSVEPEPAAVRAVPWVLLIAGVVGLAAALALAIEKFAVLSNPDHIPSCSINPLLNCGSVMSTPQAQAFGFPNPFLGLIGFSALITAAVLALGAAPLPRWFWLGLQIGTLFGVVFVHWLIFQSLYRIGALCPYCMAVWAVTIPAFWYTLVHNLHHRYLPAPGPVRRMIVGYHSTLLAGWFVVITVLILQAFWTYWTS